MTPDANVSGSGPAHLAAAGVSFPAYRLPARAVAQAWGRGSGGNGGGRGLTVGVCAPDEDVLTLSAEAARRALGHASLDPAGVDGLWWGTSRPPFAEGPSHAVLAAALGLSERAGGALVSGSTHAGMDALIAAADAIGAGAARTALVVVADALRPGPGTGFEARAGAGAAAVVLTADHGPAVLGSRVTRTRPVLDRYRGDGEDTTRDVYDPRLFREEIFLPAITEVATHLATLQPRAWSLPDPDGRLGGTVATRLGVGDSLTSRPVFGEVGDCGAAAALLGGIAGLDATGIVAIVGFGGGRTTGVTITASGPVPGAAALTTLLAMGTEVDYVTALRARGELIAAGETVPMGVPPQSAMFVRNAREMLGLVAGRCVDCGTLNTPPSIHPVCLSCGGAKFDPVELARRGVVHTFVINQTMPAPFVAPLPIAVVDLDGGGRIMTQAIGDGRDLAVGTPVEFVLRRYAHERGVPVYGLKVRGLAPITEE